MSDVVIHPRIHQRHPELSASDVLHAWEHALRSAARPSHPGTWVTIGTDTRGRLVEMVAIHDSHGQWLVYHAMTPPTRKTLTELALVRRPR